MTGIMEHCEERGHGGDGGGGDEVVGRGTPPANLTPQGRQG